MNVKGLNIEGDNVIIDADKFDWLCEQAEILKRIHNSDKTANQPENQAAFVSLRDYFAAAAMQGIMANGSLRIADGNDPVDSVAVCAYMQADAMLKAREESK